MHFTSWLSHSDSLQNVINYTDVILTSFPHKSGCWCLNLASFRNANSPFISQSKHDVLMGYFTIPCVFTHSGSAIGIQSLSSDASVKKSLKWIPGYLFEWDFCQILSTRILILCVIYEIEDQNVVFTEWEYFSGVTGCPWYGVLFKSTFSRRLLATGQSHVESDVA